MKYKILQYIPMFSLAQTITRLLHQDSFIPKQSLEREKYVHQKLLQFIYIIQKSKFCGWLVCDSEPWRNILPPEIS